MARRKKTESLKIKSIIKKAAKIYEEIIETQKNKAKKKELNYEKLVERIVDSIENKKKIDILAYDALTRKYPQTKNIINNLISELRIFSIYDSEPHTVNFDYSAYLKQIKVLIEIE